MNSYRLLVCVGIVLIQVSGANAQFGSGGLGGMLNKKLNQLTTPTNQPPAVVTDPAPTVQPPAIVSDAVSTAQPPTAQPETTTATSGSNSASDTGTVRKHKQATSPDATAQNSQSVAPSTPSETAKTQNTPEKPAEPSACSQVIELKKAMYGIPLGANLDEIKKWAEEKNVQIINRTKDTIEQDCKSGAKKLGLLSKGDNLQCDQLEQPLAELIASGDLRGEKAMKTALALDLQANCGTLKNPTFSFKGNSYILESVLARLEVIGGFCTDARITKGAYKLAFQPSEEMKADNINTIVIFLKQKGDTLVSYGAVVFFGEDQFRKVVKALSEKYGDFQVVNSDAEKTKEKLYRITGNPRAFGYNQSEYGYGGEVGLMQWRKNILLANNALDSIESNIRSPHQQFPVLYYVPDVAEQFISEQVIALHECEENLKLQKQKSQDKLKDNF